MLLQEQTQMNSNRGGTLPFQYENLLILKPSSKFSTYLTAIH